MHAASCYHILIYNSPAAPPAALTCASTRFSDYFHNALKTLWIMLDDLSIVFLVRISPETLLESLRLARRLELNYDKHLVGGLSDLTFNPLICTLTENQRCV